MFGANQFTFETPNVIDAGDLPPTPPTRPTGGTVTSSGGDSTVSTPSTTNTNTNTNTTASLSSSASSLTSPTSRRSSADSRNNDDREKDGVMADADVDYHLARESATRLLNDIRDLELQPPLPSSHIKIPLSQRLPFRDFPSRRSKPTNEMYDPYLDEDEQQQQQPYSDCPLPRNHHDNHSLPTSGEGSRIRIDPTPPQRFGRTMKLLAPRSTATTSSSRKQHSSSLPKSLFHRSTNHPSSDVQNLYDPNQQDQDQDHHSSTYRFNQLRAIFSEIFYYIQRYRYRFLLMLIGCIIIIAVTISITSKNDNHHMKDIQYINGKPIIPNFAGTDRYDLIVNYISQIKQVTSYQDLTAHDGKISTSPQNMALNWMVGVDALQYDISNPHFIQRYVLAVLYFATGGIDVATTSTTATTTTNSSKWTQSYNFMNGQLNECSWSTAVSVPTYTNDMVNMGVSCNSELDVSAIFLPNNNLQGRLPSELGSLSSLTLMGLHDNYLMGELPTSLQNLNKLLYVNLNHNQIIGTIPEYIGNWFNLEVIGLESNLMTGTLPASFGTPSRLVTIALSNNNFTGSLELLRHLTQIEYLYVSHNQFTGNIEEEFFYNMLQIRELDLSHNQFTGQFPIRMLLKGHNLHTIDVAYNSFKGTFPHEVAVPNYVLNYLNIRHNQISGTIPGTISRLSVLKHFDVTDNRIAGSIPNAIGRCAELEVLLLGNNPYNTMDDTEDVPPLSELDHLRELSLTGMNITGSIPSWIHFLDNIEMLDLSYNQLFGAIPSKVWSLPKLKYLLLNDNMNLTGPLPTSGGEQLSLLSIHHTSIVDDNFDTAVCKDTNGNNQASVETGGTGVIVFADCDSGCTTGCCNDCCDDGLDDCGSDLIASYTDGLDHVAALFAFDPSVLSEAQVFDEVNEPIENP